MTIELKLNSYIGLEIPIILNEILRKYEYSTFLMESKNKQTNKFQSIFPSMLFIIGKNYYSAKIRVFCIFVVVGNSSSSVNQPICSIFAIFRR